jgi:2-(1,2-epoxy-1,2-dihydrophenyl)acetyl-CoA isomerase
MTITFGDPTSGNSLTWDIAREIARELALNGTDAACVVLASDGPIFCGGADLALLEPLGHPDRLEEIRDAIYGAFQLMIRAIASCPVPVLAKIQGPALGAGADLALACDLRIASERAWLEESWIKLGTISALGGAQVLTSLVGAGTALDLLLTARRIGADEAMAIGAFQRVVAVESLEEEVRSLSLQIAAADRDAVRSMKALVRGGAAGEAFESALQRALPLQLPLIARPEFAARVSEIRGRLVRDPQTGRTGGRSREP